MTEQLQAMQTQIIAAVQDKLDQFHSEVSTELHRLRDELGSEREARSRTDEQLRALAAGLERSHQTSTAAQGDLQRALEERLTEFGTTTKRRHEEMAQRVDRVIDEANVGLASAVEAVTRPILRQVEHRQDKVELDVSTLDKSLRKFDEQAARMVTHINDVTGSVEGRMDQVAAGITADVETRVSGLAARLDELSAAAARQHSETSNIVGQRVDEAEQRINDRIVSVQARIEEQVGTRIADIDAFVGRVSAGLDEGIVLLNDRIAEVHGRFDEVGAQITELEKDIKTVDVEAIDEMKEKVSSAAGEAMLVRIEMERFQTTMGEAMDKSSVRLTELETQLQDQALDTETAVQLERLEEVERALIALDPSQFIRVDDPMHGSAQRSEQTDDYAGSGRDNDDGADHMHEFDFDSDSAMAPPSAPLSPPTGHNPTDSLGSFTPPANSQ